MFLPHPRISRVSCWILLLGLLSSRICRIPGDLLYFCNSYTYLVEKEESKEADLLPFAFSLGILLSSSNEQELFLDSKFHPKLLFSLHGDRVPSLRPFLRYLVILLSLCIIELLETYICSRIYRRLE